MSAETGSDGTLASARNALGLCYDNQSLGTVRTQKSRVALEGQGSPLGRLWRARTVGSQVGVIGSARTLGLDL